jgi:UPF0716 family protein affecting phage T7 exclusion
MILRQLLTINWREKFSRRGDLLIAAVLLLLPGGLVLMAGFLLCRRAIRAWRKPLPLKANIAPQP